MLKNWINIFLYHIKNNKLFTALNVLGLSIGIAGLVFAILYWNDEQSYNAWNPNKNKVFQVLSDMGKGNIWTNNPITMEPFLENDPNIEKMMFCENWYDSPLYKYKNKKQVIEKVFNAQDVFFEFFPFEFLQGSAKTVFKNPNNIAMDQKTAILFFGTENPIGKHIQDGAKILTVTAIYKVLGNSSISPDAVVNDMKKRLAENKDQW